MAQPRVITDPRFAGVVEDLGGPGKAQPNTLDRGVTVKHLRKAIEIAKRRCAQEGWRGLRPDPDGEEGDMVETAVDPYTMNLYDFNANFLFPLTLAAGKCSFAEMVNSRPRRAVFFVSHWWGEEVEKHVTCLEQLIKDRHLAEDTAFWICAFANNQHRIAEELGGGLDDSSFYKALLNTSGTVAVLDAAGTVFKRIWCVYEMFISLIAEEEMEQRTPTGWDVVKRDRTFDLYTALPDAGAIGLTDGITRRDELEGSGYLGGPSTAKALREQHFPRSLMMKGLDFSVSDAEASSENDRARILEFIAGREALLDATVGAAIGSRLAGPWLGSSSNLREVKRFCDSLSMSRIRRLTVWREGDRDPEGAQVLCDALPVTLSHLEIYGVHWKVVPGAARVLKQGPALTALELVDSQCGEERCTDIAAALAVTHRNLRRVRLDCNHLTPGACSALATGLRRHARTLEHLGLARNRGIGVGGIRALEPLLRQCTKLRVLAFMMMNIGPEGGEALGGVLEHLPLLEVLELSNNNLKAGGTAAIARGVGKHTKLTDWKMAQNDCGDEGAEAIGAAVQSHTNLNLLFVFQNNIGDSGMNALCAGLERTWGLEKLNCATNNLTDHCAQALADMLPQHPKLQDLRVHNVGFSDDGWTMIAQSLEHTRKLTWVDFGNSNLGDRGLKAVAEATAPNGVMDNFHLSGSKITDDGVEALASAVQEHCLPVKAIHITHAPVGLRGCQAIRSKFPDGCTKGGLNY